MLPVSLFSPTNSSLSAISYNPCPSARPRSSCWEVDDPNLAVAVVIHGPTQEHCVGHRGSNDGLDRVASYDDFPV